MKRILSAIALSVIVSLFPTKAYACDSFLCLGDMLGITDIAARDAQRKEKQAETEHQRTVDVARINADANARIADANRQLEAQRIQGKISEAQAKSMADAFAALVASKRDEAIAGITQNAQVAIAGINQTGETERNRLGWDAKSNMLTIAIIGLLLLTAMLILYRRTNQAPQITVMLANPQRGQLEQPDTVYLSKTQYNMIGDDYNER